MEEFFYILVFFALIYLVAVKAIMLKTGMKEVNKVNKDLNDLNKRLMEATKRKDDAEIDRLTKEQQELMQKMMGMFGTQMKMTLVILVIFMTFVWALNSINPYVQDDLILKNISGSINQSFEIKNPDMNAFKITAKNAKNDIVSGYVYVSPDKGILTNLTNVKYTLDENGSSSFFDGFCFMLNCSAHSSSIYPSIENDSIMLRSGNISVFESVEYDNGTEINNFVPILDILGIRFVYGAQGTFILLTFIASMVEQALLGKRISDALEKIIK